MWLYYWEKPQVLGILCLYVLLKRARLVGKLSEKRDKCFPYKCSLNEIKVAACCYMKAAVFPVMKSNADKFLEM